MLIDARTWPQHTALDDGREVRRATDAIDPGSEVSSPASLAVRTTPGPRADALAR